MLMMKNTRPLMLQMLWRWVALLRRVGMMLESPKSAQL